jgi:hypothetical protein
MLHMLAGFAGMRRAAATLLLVLAIAPLASCGTATEEDYQRMDAYRAAQRCCGGGGP